MDLSKTIVKIKSQKDLDIIYLILSIQNPEIKSKKIYKDSAFMYCRINSKLNYYKGANKDCYDDFIIKHDYKEITMEDIIKL